MFIKVIFEQICSIFYQFGAGTFFKTGRSLKGCALACAEFRHTQKLTAYNTAVVLFKLA